jgi:hypothetical protein
VRRFAQDDGLVGVLKKNIPHKLALWGEAPSAVLSPRSQAKNDAYPSDLQLRKPLLETRNITYKQNCHLDRSVPGFPATPHWKRPPVRLSLRNFTNATNTNRKSGAAEWRDLRFLQLSVESKFIHPHWRQDPLPRRLLPSHITNLIFFSQDQVNAINNITYSKNQIIR